MIKLCEQKHVHILLCAMSRHKKALQPHSKCMIRTLQNYFGSVGFIGMHGRTSQSLGSVHCQMLKEQHLLSFFNQQRSLWWPNAEGKEQGKQWNDLRSSSLRNDQQTSGLRLLQSNQCQRPVLLELVSNGTAVCIAVQNSLHLAYHQQQDTELEGPLYGCMAAVLMFFLFCTCGTLQVMLPKGLNLHMMCMVPLLQILQPMEN